MDINEHEYALGLEIKARDVSRLLRMQFKKYYPLRVHECYLDSTKRLKDPVGCRTF